jgi:hypothetical protein
LAFLFKKKKKKILGFYFVFLHFFGLVLFFSFLMCIQLSYPHLVGGCGIDAILMQRNFLMKKLLKPHFHISKIGQIG